MDWSSPSESFPSWPTPQGYAEALRDPASSLVDPALRAGVADVGGMVTGTSAMVVRVRSDGRDHAVRCFLRDVPGRRERYAAIDQHLQAVGIRQAVAFDYLDEGIRVAGAGYPILRMDWVPGLTLDAYVARHLDDRAALDHLVERFVELLGDLASREVAHGDLEHGNLLVLDGSEGPTIKVVDYDGMWVPALDGRESDELGHPNYQHPARTRSDFGPTLDGFSGWSILTSLLAVRAEPALWTTVRPPHADDRLLLGRGDYVATATSPTLARLRRSPDDAARHAVETLVAACPPRQRALGIAPPTEDDLGRDRGIRQLSERLSTPIVGAAGAGIGWLASQVSQHVPGTSTRLAGAPASPAPAPPRVLSTPKAGSARPVAKPAAQPPATPASRWRVGAIPGAFIDAMTAGYALDEPGIVVGGPMLGADVIADEGARVRVALSMLNRHGLVAGATGTGKTKTLQALAGQMSNAGIPCFIADVKGDLTGMAEPGDATNPKVVDRCTRLGWQMQPAGHPVELLSLTGKLGVPVRASVHSFGPLLLAKVLDLNETQTAVLSLVFAYCDDNALPLLDLADLRTTVTYLASDEGKPAMAEYGGIAPATASVILRSLVTLEQQGAKDFFGMPEFDVRDLLRTENADGTGRGVVSLLELSDVMDRPRLFSTFMLWLLAQLYTVLPEVGDLPKPKLCFFFDEAHLLFADASPALLEQIERTARLIRSKGVGVWFVADHVDRIPEVVRTNLANRIVHALRAFTPQDVDNLAMVVKSLPASPFYPDVAGTITSLGISEALVTVLSPRGVPTPLAATMVVPPDSLMAALPPEQVAALAAASPLQARYGTPVDPDSAHEMITRQIAAARAAAAAAAAVPRPPTPAQLEREQARQAREQAAAQAKAERDAAAAQRAAERDAAAEARRQPAARRAAERDAAAQRRAAERQQQQLIRAGMPIATPVIRSVFGTLFGGKG